MKGVPLIDHHIHTVYSGHAEQNMTVNAIIDCAEQQGLKSIAITEHAFYYLMGQACFEQIKHEVDLASTQIKVFTGLEMDPDYKNPGHLVFEDFEKGDILPVLVGTHSYPNTGRGWCEKLNLTKADKRGIYSSWFDLMEKVVANPLVDVLAHPGRLISQNGIIEEFDKNVLKDFRSLFFGAREKGISIELNDNAVGRFATERLRKSYPDVIRLALEMGLKISLGSDAHRLDDIGRRDYIAGIIDTLGLLETDIYVPKERTGTI